MLKVLVALVDATRGLRASDDIVEEFDGTASDVYRLALKEYGRCTGKVYVDTRAQDSVHVGWVFQKRVPYSDAPDKSYLQEAWVTFVDVAPETRRSVPVGEV